MHCNTFFSGIFLRNRVQPVITLPTITDGNGMMFKDFCVDVFIAGLKAQTQKRVFQDLAQIVSPVCSCAVTDLDRILERRLSERTFGMEAGVSVFDVQSSLVKTPVIVLATLENKLDFKALDGNLVDIVAAVISPRTEGGYHLQKISWISRLLRDQNLCGALRSAKDEDAMRVLFLPPQQENIAAA